MSEVPLYGVYRRNEQSECAADMPTSSEINAEIYSFGPILFEAVCNDIRLRATWADSATEYAANRVRLDAEIEKVLRETIQAQLDHRALWQAVWPHIVYAGTLASKASKEVESMREMVPLFQDLDNYSPEAFRFNPKEWDSFVRHWKSKLPVGWPAAKWLEYSKRHPEWNPEEYFSTLETTPEVWRILIRDDAIYPTLRFSAKADKVSKYLNFARLLYEDRKQGSQNPFHQYTGGRSFNADHQTGESWVQERKDLGVVLANLEKHLGKLTALHTMMDLGFKTIKPDRVMTYLFSQLGWLQTLPSSWSKTQVIDAYLHPSVIEEMTIRADVLAAAISKRGYSQAHRRLDIWFVKYGQEPDLSFGITRNLQDFGPGIRSLYMQVMSGHKTDPEKASSTCIGSEVANNNWPTREFHENEVRSVAPKCIRSQVKAKSERMSRSDAEKIFIKQWREGFAMRPEVYPSARVGISNDAKEKILRNIEKGMHPDVAFLSVLGPKP